MNTRHCALAALLLASTAVQAQTTPVQIMAPMAGMLNPATMNPIMMMAPMGNMMNPVMMLIPMQMLPAAPAPAK